MNYQREDSRLAPVEIEGRSEDFSDLARGVAEFQVGDSIGMHMRPVSELVRAASRYPGTVEVEYNGERVDATSIMDVLTLAIGKGEKFRLLFGELYARKKDNSSEVCDLVRKAVNG